VNLTVSNIEMLMQYLNNSVKSFIRLTRKLY